MYINDETREKIDDCLLGLDAAIRRLREKEELAIASYMQSKVDTLERILIYEAPENPAERIMKIFEREKPC